MEFNFADGPTKVLVDRFMAQQIGGHMHLMLQSGSDQSVFVIDPALAKKIAKYFSASIAELEKQAGIVFDDRLDHEPMPSPLHVPEGK